MSTRLADAAVFLLSVVALGGVSVAVAALVTLWGDWIRR